MQGMAWLDTASMADFLRVGEESHGIIEALGRAVPEYVEITTGYSAELMRGLYPCETARQLARFLVLLWFNPDGTDSPQVRQVVDALTLALKAMVADVPA